MTRLKKILHIDDDAMMRMMVQKSIERSQKDFEIVCCAEISAFIDNLSSFQPDLLIIDVVMPVLGGPQLLEKIRNLPNTTPAIFMTGHESLHLENEEKLHPVIGVIQKPFSPLSLGEDISALWESHLTR